MSEMTTNHPSPAKQAADAAELRIAIEKDSLVDRLADQMSDYCSPILVKETRQALKSRQFFLTFFLLLTAIALWTMLGLTFNDARVQFGNAGPNLLTGYWFILGLPLAIVIPFGTYRSLAREYEDGTIQLVSVTTMKAWQIVAGKLGSSMLQMLIYLSILAPCIAFTYLLRGLSLPQISIGMLICISGCICLSTIALFFAGATRSRVYGVGASIILIAIQIVVLIFWWIFSAYLATGNASFMSGSGLFLGGGLIMAMLSTAALMFAASAAMISFEADNRSTLVRLMMVLQQTLFIGWAYTFSCISLTEDSVFVFTFITAHYWLITGFVMISEKPELSTRVKRQIPQSLLGRLLASFYLPGSGRALIFSTTNIWFCGLAFFLMYWVGAYLLPQPSVDLADFPSNREIPALTDLPQQAMAMFTLCTYASFFLAATYLIFRGLRWSGRKVGGISSLLIGVVLIFICTFMTLIVQFNLLSNSYVDDYTILQLPNWYWTTNELFYSRSFYAFPVLFFDSLLLSFCAAAWYRAAGELSQTRELLPEKVESEIAEERAVEQIPEGESLDEIFGVIEKKPNQSEPQ